MATAILRRLISRSRTAGISRVRRGYNSAGNSMSLSSSATNHLISSNSWIPRPPTVDGGAELVGYSHGWSALFDKRNNDLFLSDPLSHRRIDLPPIDELPDPDFNLDLDGHGSVSKVVLSSSPEDDDGECRAMMTFGPSNRAAYCVPGRSSEWTPVGSYFFDYDVKDPYRRYARVHEDLVYCTKRNVFTSITACHLDLHCLLDDCLNGFEMSADSGDDEDKFPLERCDWDIRDPHSPAFEEGIELYATKKGKSSGRTRLWVKNNRNILDRECVQIAHLVYAEESDRLFLVMRFVRGDCGSVPRCGVRGLGRALAGKTFGFVVLKIEDEKDLCTILEDDLEGMSIFVGQSSYAISSSSSSSHPFKPNSIYFTDAKRIPRLYCDDAGVFDYATKTITSTTR